MSEQQLELELAALKSKRAAVEALLDLNEGERKTWCETNNFRLYRDYTTQDLKDKEAQLSTEINHLLAQGKFYLSIIYYFWSVLCH